MGLEGVLGRLAFRIVKCCIARCFGLCVHLLGAACCYHVLVEN
jgi:hypothetical protein